MNEQELKVVLLEIAGKLTQIAGGGEVALPLDHPPGTIRVAPTGVMGEGKVRYWPEGMKQVPPSNTPELFWSYLLRMTYTKDPQGEPYIPQIYRQQLGHWFQGGGPGPEMMHLYGAHADRWVYPEDWMTAEEIETKKMSDLQWGQNEHNMMG